MNWNDDRIDRLADQVEAMRGEIATLRSHVDEGFKMQEARIHDRFYGLQKSINDRFDKLQTSLVIALAGILAAFASVVLPAVF